MTLEELGTLVNNIKQAPDDVTRSEHLATLVDDYRSMLTQVTDLSSKNEELAASNVKYAQLNQDLFLKVGLGGGYQPQEHQAPSSTEEPREKLKYEDLELI